MRRGRKDTLDGGCNIIRKTIARNSSNSGQKEMGTGNIAVEE